MLPSDPQAIIASPERLKVLHEFLLLDTEPEVAFDRLTQLASRIVHAPISMVSLIDANRHFFKSAVGLPDFLQTKREIPLTHSVCKHVVTTGEPLVIQDTREHPLVHDNVVAHNLNIISYLGMPLKTTQGVDLGSFCVIDNQPRTWTDEEIAIMEMLAQSVMTEIELRGELIARKKAEAKLNNLYAELENSYRQLRRMTEFAQATLEHTIDAVQHGAASDEVMTYLMNAQRALSRKDKTGSLKTIQN